MNLFYQPNTFVNSTTLSSSDLLEYCILLSYPEWLDSFPGGLVDKFDQYHVATDKPVNRFQQTNAQKASK